MENFKNKFIEEAIDLINELELASLELEKNPDDNNIIGRIFRVMHSLKGGSAMFGFDKISEFTHHLESIYDNLREGNKKPDKELLNITFASADHIKEILGDHNLKNKELLEKHQTLLKRILNYYNNLHNTAESTVIEENNTNPEINNNNQQKTYFITFKPGRDILKKGTNPLFLVEDLSMLGKSIVYARKSTIPPLEEIDPMLCYLFWDVLLATNAEENTIREVFIFVENECELVVEKIADIDLVSNPGFIEKIEQLQSMDLNELKKIVSDYINKKALTNNNNLTATKKDGFVNEINKNKASEKKCTSSIRVSSEKVDHLMNLVSELVTIQARLELYTESVNAHELKAISEIIQKLTLQLRDNAFSICLIPINDLLIRFQRLVRDLSIELKKEIIFTAEGTDTELDKTIIESLTEPILHVLRNSIDHGIEEVDERLKKGKPAQGQILLKAFYSGVNVILQIIDDGRGINIEKVKEKAVSKGLIAPDANISKKDLLELLFLPGFSTSDHVTDVSGRGVGMDVVKRKITGIYGEVDIDTEKEKGTTITIRLPLTLSIIDGLLVKIIDENYIIPLSSVNKIYAIESKTIINSHNNLIVIDGEKIPFYDLSEEFNVRGHQEKTLQLVVVNYQNVNIGLIIDQIIGIHQAVLKPLGKLYSKQDIISGASILGDGTIALVMDTHKIIKKFSGEEKQYEQNFK